MLTTSCKGEGGSGKSIDIRHSLKDSHPINAAQTRSKSSRAIYLTNGMASIALIGLTYKWVSVARHPSRNCSTNGCPRAAYAGT
jgi:hypothetical protein